MCSAPHGALRRATQYRRLGIISIAFEISWLVIVNNDAPAAFVFYSRYDLFVSEI